MTGIPSRLGLLATVALQPASAEVNRSWEKLMETVEIGKSVAVAVQRTTPVQIEGKLLEITADSVTVRWRSELAVIKREDVLRLRYANIQRRNTFLGMAIGAGVGAISFMLSRLGDYRHHYRLYAAAGAITGVGPGAAVGGVLPIGEPLYEAPKSSRTAGP